MISNQFKNSKTGDTDETKINNQFQLKDQIETIKTYIIAKKTITNNQKFKD